MNIFATNSDPVASARYLDTARQVKMTLESCQMLVTSLSVFDKDAPQRFQLRPTHPNHPCNVWVRHSRHNWLWLYEHMIAMDDDHRLRLNKSERHATRARLEDLRIHRFWRKLPSEQGTTHVNAARNNGIGVDFTWVPDVYEAYRMYLNARWQIQVELAALGQRQKPVLCRFTPM